MPLQFLSEIDQPDLGRSAVCRVYLSDRARQPRISISADQGLRLILPARLRRNQKLIGEILEKRRLWIIKHWQKINSPDRKRLALPEEIKTSGGKIEKNSIRLRAQERIESRVAELAEIKGISFNRVFVKNQKRCWGSCSTGRNLSFNWRIVLLPPELADYVIFHELAHLKQMNHSSGFWTELEKLYPGSQIYKKLLKKYDY